MRRLLIGAAIATSVAIFLAALFFMGYFTPASAPPLDTKTHSFAYSGFYGKGAFTGEFLQSEKILTNITNNNASMSQDVVMQGQVCQQQSGLGTVFIDGSKVTEPDAMYKVYVNSVLVQTYAIEIGDSTPTLTQCLALPLRDYIMTGSINGFVHVDMLVYVFDFQSGSGGYKVLLNDQAALTTASK